MKPVLLIDFGSTYTKVTAVDVDEPKLLGRASSYTTVQRDINEGLSKALALLEEQTGRLDFSERYACSSAAGGLRMVTSGLVTELTAEAAKQASLGAGAKVVKCFSYQMTEEDVAEIDGLHPDIFLLTGGIDGGNETCILHNAGMLASCQREFPIIIAGNRVCASRCKKLLEGRQIYVCENVMPRFGELNILPVQQKIRDIFLERIIVAKGMTQAADLLSEIVMPTPSAMLSAMKLLADGTESEHGVGELVGVDVGGATTDVYSIADGSPQNVKTVIKGLPEPYAKRTVEGDIGMRYSLEGIVEAVGIRKISQVSGLNPSKAEKMAEDFRQHTDWLPKTEEEKRLDFALACGAVETAVTRHAGTAELVYTADGEVFLQIGKDLRSVQTLVVTGGALIYDPNVAEIASHALFNPQLPSSLKPVSAKIWVDRWYILAAMGLLGEHYPNAALQLMKKELSYDGTTK